jgi:hypothetical protein
MYLERISAKEYANLVDEFKPSLRLGGGRLLCR